MKIPFLFLSALFVGTAATLPEGTLGVLLGEITPQISQAAGLEQVSGAVIQQVTPGSAAARAGLLAGDLIVGVDNIGVTCAEDVVRRVGKHSPGESVALVILRPDGRGHVQQFPLRAVLQPAATNPGSVQPGPTQPAPAGGRVGSAPPQQPGSTLSALGTKFTGSALPVKIHVTQFGNCYAIAPTDWVIYGVRREADAFDIGAPDFSSASWGVRGVAGWMIRNDPRLASPETTIHHALSGHLLGQNWHVSYGQPMQDDFGYTWLPYEKDTVPPRKGVVIYRAWPTPGDPFGFVMVSRMVETIKALWESRGALAIAVAVSIRCTTQLRPSPDAVGRSRTPDDKMESTYNQTLGTEYAHNPDTGELYWMNHSSDWKENGPEGPGYYVSSGNELRKLVQGLPQP